MSEFFNVLMSTFYICAVVGIIIKQLDNTHGVTIKMSIPINSQFSII